jgi:glycosyltransferase involved in cell wall biosynthesis
MSLRIVVTGLVAQHPQLGGMTWHYLQYVAGLARLGHDVYYVEDSGEVPYNQDGGASGHDWVAKDWARNVAYLARTLARYGLEERWAYRYAPTSQWLGLPDARRADVLRSADLLINVSGTLEHPDRYRQVRRLVYVDTDPVVTQLKIAAGGRTFRARVDAHDVHFSFGERLGEGVPTTGHRWRPTRQPVLLSEWRTTEAPRETFTTVMSWTSYAPLRHGGRDYGQKDVEFRRFLDLPGRVAPLGLEVALGSTQHLEWEALAAELPPRLLALARERGDWTPRDLVRHAGWRVVDASEACGDLDRYRAYVRSSKGEWSVAKNAYVQGQPGWFSERSACYLAAGRPVVVQDTGLAGVLPVGEGVLAFRSLEEAAEALREVEGDYARHAKAARGVAEACFDSDRVLTRLVEEAMQARPEAPAA